MGARRIAGWTLLLTGGAFATLTLGGLAGLAPFKVNGTRSLPRGLYVRSFEEIRPGAIVWFPLPDALRAYVAGVPGAAAWFEHSSNGLMKPVIGTEGDVICRDADGVFSRNGEALGRAAATGPDGRPAPTWQGCRRLAEGELAVFSDRLPDSLDSRLYGPVKAAGARVYRPLWTEGR
jgi:type IV secretory pathway protease TraF